MLITAKLISSKFDTQNNCQMWRDKVTCKRLPVMQVLTTWPRKVQPATKQRWKYLSSKDCILDDGLHFMCCDSAVPHARSLRGIDLQAMYMSAIAGGRGWMKLTMQFPAYLCPPVWEFFKIRAFFCPGSSLSWRRIFSVRSSGVAERDSKGGPTVLARSSSCVCTSQSWIWRDRINSNERISQGCCTLRKRETT